MNNKDKQVALIEAYIEVCQKENYDDNQIIESLIDIYDQAELEDLGFGNFISDYFASCEVRKWHCHDCGSEWFVEVDGSDHPSWCPYCGQEVNWHLDSTNRLYMVELE